MKYGMQKKIKEHKYTKLHNLYKIYQNFKEKRVCHSFLFFIPFLIQKKADKNRLSSYYICFKSNEELANSATANLTATASATSATAEQQQNPNP